MKKLYIILSLLLSLFLIIGCFNGCADYDKDANIYFELYEIPKSLDPQTAESVSELIAVRNIYEGLTRKNENDEIVLACAESYTLNKNTYTFKLKDNLVWSDGTPLTAYDFEFAFKRAVSKKTNAPFVSRIFCIKNAKEIFTNNLSASKLGVKATDKKTLTIKLSQKDENFLSTLATAIAMPCNEEFFNEAIGKYGLTAETTLSNGSYKLSRWDQEKFKIKLSRNDEYKGEFSPKNAAVFLTRNEETRAIDLLKDDDVDASFIDCALVDAAKQSGLETKSFENICWILTMSNELPKSIRKSLALLVKSEAAISKMPDGFSPATSIFPNIYTDSKITDKYTKYSLEEGKKLYFEAVKSLEDKKFPSGVVLSYSDNGYFKDVITAIAGHWQHNLGAYVNITEVEKKINLSSQLVEQTKTMSIFPVSTADNNLNDYLMHYGIIYNGKEKLQNIQNGLVDNYNIVPIAFSNTTICYGNGVDNLFFDAENGYIDFSFATKEK